MRRGLPCYLRDLVFGTSASGSVLPRRDLPSPSPIRNTTPAASRRDTIIRLSASIHANAAGPDDEFDMRRMILEIWDLWRNCPSIHGEDDDDWVAGGAA